MSPSSPPPPSHYRLGYEIRRRIRNSRRRDRGIEMDTNMYPDMYWHMKDNSNKNSHTTPIRGNQIDIEEEDEGRCIPCNITSTSASNTKTWNNTNTGEKRRKKVSSYPLKDRIDIEIEENSHFLFSSTYPPIDNTPFSSLPSHIPKGKEKVKGGEGRELLSSQRIGERDRTGQVECNIKENLYLPLSIDRKRVTICFTPFFSLSILNKDNDTNKYSPSYSACPWENNQNTNTNKNTKKLAATRSRVESKRRNIGSNNTQYSSKGQYKGQKSLSSCDKTVSQYQPQNLRNEGQKKQRRNNNLLRVKKQNQKPSALTLTFLLILFQKFISTLTRRLLTKKPSHWGLLVSCYLFFCLSFSSSFPQLPLHVVSTSTEINQSIRTNTNSLKSRPTKTSQTKINPISNNSRSSSRTKVNGKDAPLSSFSPDPFHKDIRPLSLLASLSFDVETSLREENDGENEDDANINVIINKGALPSLTSKVGSSSYSFAGGRHIEIRDVSLSPKIHAQLTMGGWFKAHSILGDVSIQSASENHRFLISSCQYPFGHEEIMATSPSQRGRYLSVHSQEKNNFQLQWSIGRGKYGSGYLSASSSSSSSFTTALDDEEWHFVAVVYDEHRKKATLYVDGIHESMSTLFSVDESINYNNNIPEAAPTINAFESLIHNNNNSSLCLGSDGTTDGAFWGNLDSIFIYRAALSIDDLDYLMSEGNDNEAVENLKGIDSRLPLSSSKDDADTTQRNPHFMTHFSSFDSSPKNLAAAANNITSILPYSSKNTFFEVNSRNQERGHFPTAGSAGYALFLDGRNGDKLIIQDTGLNVNKNENLSEGISLQWWTSLMRNNYKNQSTEEIPLLSLTNNVGFDISEQNTVERDALLISVLQDHDLDSSALRITAVTDSNLSKVATENVVIPLKQSLFSNILHLSVIVNSTHVTVIEDGLYVFCKGFASIELSISSLKSATLVFGSWNSFNEFHFQAFIGMIDEIRIWSTSLAVVDLTTNLGDKFGLEIDQSIYSKNSLKFPHQISLTGSVISKGLASAYQFNEGRGYICKGYSSVDGGLTAALVIRSSLSNDIDSNTNEWIESPISKHLMSSVVFLPPERRIK